MLDQYWIINYDPNCINKLLTEQSMPNSSIPAAGGAMSANRRSRQRTPRRVDAATMEQNHDPVVVLVAELLDVKRRLLPMTNMHSTEYQMLEDREETLQDQISWTRPASRLGALALLEVGFLFAEQATLVDDHHATRAERAWRRCFFSAMDFLASPGERASIGHPARLNPWVAMQTDVGAATDA